MSIVTVSTVEQSSSSSSWSHDHAIGDGGDSPVLLIAIHINTPSVSSITFNGVAPTLIDEPGTGDMPVYALYGGDVPSAGTYTLSFSHGANRIGDTTVVLLSSAVQAIPSDSGTGTGTSSDFSNSISVTNDNSWIFDFVAYNATEGAASADTGQTEDTNKAFGGDTNRTTGVSHKTATSSGSYSMGWSSGSSVAYDQTIVAIAPGATATDSTEHSHTAQKATVTSGADNTEHSHTVDKAGVTATVNSTEHAHRVQEALLEGDTRANDTTHTHTVNKATVTSQVNSTVHAHSVEQARSITPVQSTEHLHTVSNVILVLKVPTVTKVEIQGSKTKAVL